MFTAIATWFAAKKASIIKAALLSLAGLAALMCLGITCYDKGHAAAALACETDKTAAIVKGETTHANIEIKVMRLPDVDLDRQLRAKWLRD